MHYVIAIVLLVVALIFWKYLLYGAIGAVLFGFFGSLVGDALTTVGAIFGFLIGLKLAAKPSERDSALSRFNEDEPSSSRSPKPKKRMLHWARNAVFGVLALVVVLFGLSTWVVEKGRATGPSFRLADVVYPLRAVVRYKLARKRGK